MIPKNILVDLYVNQTMSMQEIALKLNCSLNKVHYWMKKHNIPKRSISDAVYIKNNPNGDPFVFMKPKTKTESILYGMGLGLYWGEGTKANRHAVRLGNSDPELIVVFISFLERIFCISKKDMKFGLQLFSDVDKNEALIFWKSKLGVIDRQFYKVTITKSGAIGTYRKKSKYGVLTVYYNNVKLRNLLIELLREEGFGQ